MCGALRHTQPPLRTMVQSLGTSFPQITALRQTLRGGNCQASNAGAAAATTATAAAARENVPRDQAVEIERP